jgi:hypothetical protein
MAAVFVGRFLNGRSRKSLLKEILYILNHEVARRCEGNKTEGVRHHDCMTV